MEEKSIEEVVVHIIKERLRVNPELLIRENYDIPLTGKIFSFYARDLVYLLFEIESEFSIQITPERLSKGDFNTIAGIIKLLKDSS